MLDCESTSPTPTAPPSLAERIDHAQWMADLLTNAVGDLVNALAELDADDVPEPLRTADIVILAEDLLATIMTEVGELREPDDDDDDLDEPVGVAR